MLKQDLKNDPNAPICSDCVAKVETYHNGTIAYVCSNSQSIMYRQAVDSDGFCHHYSLDTFSIGKT